MARSFRRRRRSDLQQSGRVSSSKVQSFASMIRRDEEDKPPEFDHSFSVRPVYDHDNSKPGAGDPQRPDLSRNFLDIPTSSHLLSYDHFGEGFVRDRKFLRYHPTVKVTTVKLEFTVRWAFPWKVRVFLVRLPTDAGIGQQIVHDAIPFKGDRRVGVNLGWQQNDSCSALGGIYDERDTFEIDITRKRLNPRVKVLKQWSFNLPVTAPQAGTMFAPLGRARKIKCLYQNGFIGKYNPDKGPKDSSKAAYEPPNSHPHFIVTFGPGWNPYGHFAKPGASSPGLSIDRFYWDVYFRESPVAGIGYFPDPDQRSAPHLYPVPPRFPGGITTDDHMDTKEDAEGGSVGTRMVEWRAHLAKLFPAEEKSVVVTPPAPPPKDGNKIPFIPPTIPGSGL